MCFNSHLSLFSTSLPAVFLASILMGRQEWVGTNKSWSLGSGRICFGDVYMLIYRASLADETVKEPACNAGDLGLIPGLGISPGEGNGNPLQYSCLENSMDRGAWRVTVAKSQTWLMTKHNTHMHVLLSFRCPFNCQPWLFLFLCLTPGDFPNSPVVKTLSFQCKRHGFDPWLGN